MLKVMSGHFHSISLAGDHQPAAIVRLVALCRALLGILAIVASDLGCLRLLRQEFLAAFRRSSSL